MPSPTASTIHVRNLRFFDHQPTHPRWWHGNDPVATAFFNALSATFPQGEKFFMDSVRHYRRSVSSDLQAQIKNFIGQEAVHSREHAAFNEIASDVGYDITSLEDRTRRALDPAHSEPPIRQLMVTCALEHFTAILAHALLANDERDMIGASEDMARLWAWHAMEEIEHKSVAYDTFLEVTAKRSGFTRYWNRVLVMLVSTGILFRTIAGNMGDLYRADGLHGRRIWLRTLNYLIGKPGILRRVSIDYLRYFKPGFHPWQQDDRKLLAKTEARISAFMYSPVTA